MKNIVFVCSIVGLLLLCSCSVAATKKILIVGAGINGASAAYFLRQEEPDGNKLEIHVAEAEAKVGGRVLDTEIVRATGAKKLVEVGASVYHSVNKYMVHFAKLANATPTRPYINSKLGVWDGLPPPPPPGTGQSHRHSTFPFKESELMSPLDKAVTSIQALWRYKSAVMKLGGCVENLVEKLLRWYEMQEQGHVFDTVEDMLEAVDLRRFATEETLVEYLTSAECGMDANSPLLSEIIHGMVRLNYGQHYQTINALAGCVALKGRGDEVFGVEGGNKRIISALMEKADVKQVHLGCPVTIKNGGVSSTCSLVEEMKWDAVILAHPRWEEDANTKKQDTPSLQDQTAMFITVVSFVEGFLNETVFDDSLPPTVTVTSLKARQGRLRNIRHVGRVSSPAMSGDQSEVFPGIYKMFSDTPLSKDDLAQIFHTDAASGFVAKVLYSHEWRGAYPDLSQKQTSSKLASHKPANKQSKRFVLSAASNQVGPVIIDANALEVVVSTMETQSIAAKNAALLAKRELGLGEVHSREKAAVEDKNEL